MSGTILICWWRQGRRKFRYDPSLLSSQTGGDQAKFWLVPKTVKEHHSATAQPGSCQISLSGLWLQSLQEDATTTETSLERMMHSKNGFKGRSNFGRKQWLTVHQLRQTFSKLPIPASAEISATRMAVCPKSYEGYRTWIRGCQAHSVLNIPANSFWRLLGQGWRSM